MKHRNHLIAALLGGLSLALSQGPACGTIRHVYETDGAQGIQDSINVSGSNDTVVVQDGTYWIRDAGSTGIVMKDSVVLMSANGAEFCTLNALNSSGTDTAYHVIYCHEFNEPYSCVSVIQGFTMVHGRANGGWPHFCGGGIFCRKASVRIQGNIIEDNQAGFGSGIYCDSSASSVIEDNRIKGNRASSGGGISCMGSAVTILNNTIEQNEAADRGGGIFCGNSSPTIRNNRIIRNSAYASGGAVHCFRCSCFIQNNMVQDNLGLYGGGIACEQSSLEIEHSVISGNMASGAGGAIYSWSDSRVSLDSCFAVDNGSIGNAKSGLICLCGDADTTWISNSHLYYNTFQPDTEIRNISPILFPLRHNYWWDTTESGIAGLIEGLNDHVPWETDFIAGVPGEPLSVDSVRNYSSDFSSVVNYLENDPDTLCLRIYGQDRMSNRREVAVVIVRSRVYSDGIAVALAETDTNSGIYEGRSVIRRTTGSDIIRQDDVRQIVRVNRSDTITISANVDTTEEFVVLYHCIGLEEAGNILDRVGNLSICPNLSSMSVDVTYRLRFPADVLLRICDVSGRVIRTLVEAEKGAGAYSVALDTRDLPSGVYFAELLVCGDSHGTQANAYGGVAESPGRGGVDVVTDDSREIRKFILVR
jgi:hypothetical protein